MGSSKYSSELTCVCVCVCVCVFGLICEKFHRVDKFFSALPFQRMNVALRAARASPQQGAGAQQGGGSEMSRGLQSVIYSSPFPNRNTPPPPSQFYLSHSALPRSSSDRDRWTTSSEVQLLEGEGGQDAKTSSAKGENTFSKLSDSLEEAGRVYLVICLQRTTPRCNTLQHCATYCKYAGAHCYTLRYTAMHYITLQRTATTCNDCNTLQHTATCCSTLQHAAAHCNMLQHTATCIDLQATGGPSQKVGNALQHTATHCQTYCHVLQHTATHCTTLHHIARKRCAL